MYDRLLLPTDGSEPARRAQRHARMLAVQFDATIHVLTVTEDASTGKEALAGATDYLGSVEWESATRAGQPVREILRYADENACDMIVMGTHGRQGIRRAIAGSVAEGVLRRADVPVFTVQDDGESGDPTPYERILLPTDGSQQSEAALEPAVAIAAAFDATIHVVGVVDVNTVAAQSELANPNVISGQLRDQCEAATERVAERIEEAGIDGERVILEGAPSDAILDHSREADCDLIVMSTHGRTGLERALVGSTTERTVRRAEMPVVSVAASEE